MPQRLARRGRTSLLLALVIATALIGGSAHAAGVKVSEATPAQVKEALKHFRAGGTAIAKRDYQHAIAEYRASLDVIDSPNSRLELARALRDSGQLADAWTEYGQTADDGRALDAAHYAKTIESATTERAEVEGKIAVVTVTVSNAPAGATLRIGTTQVATEGWGKPLALLPQAQPIDVVLSADGAEVARQSVPADAGRKSAVTLSPPAPPVAVGPPPPEAPPHSEFEAVPGEPAPPPPSRPANRLRPFAYVAGGVGVAGLATFAIAGAMSHSTYNDLLSKCHGVCPPGNESEISSGRTDQAVANVGLVIGALGLASGVGLFVMSLPSSNRTTAFVIEPGWVGVRGSL